MTRNRSTRSTFIVAMLLALGASLAGCVGNDDGGDESTLGPTDGTDGTQDRQTADRDTDITEAPTGVGCYDAEDAGASQGSTGSTQEGEVGTGFGDIGSPTSCIDNEQGGAGNETGGSQNATTEGDAQAAG